MKCTALYRIPIHCILLYCKIFYSTILYYSILQYQIAWYYCIVFYNIRLYDIVQNWTVQYCTALYCINQYQSLPAVPCCIDLYWRVTCYSTIFLLALISNIPLLIKCENKVKFTLTWCFVRPSTDTPLISTTLSPIA